MLMSKSRLEKFLYALYSLDYSDLPTPLSRIEELYNCLVTGVETPTFKPLSRVEKYLMAILGAYDADSLPNPLSRVEVLLYKLATGDDNLDGFDTFLSEHEELLAEIIRNGGVGGNIDIEYVLYTLSTEHNTLYNTSEKPVKSAILKGDSQRVFSPTKNLFDGELEQGTINSSTGNNSDLSTAIRSKNFVEIGVNTAFTLSRKKGTASLGFRCYDKNKNFLGTIFTAINAGTLKVTYTTDSNTVYIRFIDNTNDLTNKYQIEIGSTATDYEEPNYELKSVKMPVLKTTWKNLFDGKLEYGLLNANNGLPSNSNDYVRSQNFIPINCETITFTVINGECGLSFYYYDKDKNFISSKTKMKVSDDLSIPDGVAYLKFRTYPISDESITNNLNTQIQIEQGSVATEYEPYKSNILTVNEPVELRKVGNIQDELNLLTGELTQRIGEVVLDGSDDLAYNYEAYSNDTTTMVHVLLPNTNRNFDFYNDKLPQKHIYDITNVTEGVFADWGGLFIRLLNSKLSSPDSNGVKEYLQSEPITVQYQLATGSVKTIDISTVNQDGNDTKLSTFNDITHVTLSSEGLIPEAELEVATKNEEDLEDTSVYTIHTLSEGYNTLYNTAEKPVKSAILKGQTLVNVHPTDYVVGGSNNTFFLFKIIPKTMIKPNTRYFLRLYNTHQSIVRAYFKPCVNNSVNLISSDNKCAIFTTKSEFTENDFNNNKIHFYSSSELALEDVKDTKVILCEYVDGMENWDIPYFEGMKSVQMPVLKTLNKQHDALTLLFNQTPWNRWDWTTLSFVETFNGRFKVKFKDSVSSTLRFNIFTTEENTFTNEELKNGIDVYFTEVKHIGFHSLEDGITSGKGIDILKEMINNGDIEFKLYEDGFKSDILTCNEDVELRGIGEVKDELDLTTGELTQRIGEIVLDGSQDGGYDHAADESTGILTLRLPKIPDIKNTGGNILGLLSDKYASVTSKKPNNILSYNSRIMITKPISELESFNTADKIKSFLSQNPITVQYPLATPIIKTIDISTVNQDGNDTKLSTFNDITHVTLSSEGLIPEAELEVAEKVPEVAANMFTISREQEVINTTINEQSENVDATMIATTEIYEELL